MVDLPQPDGPSRATKAPAGAARSTSSRADDRRPADLELLAEVAQGDAAVAGGPPRGRRRLGRRSVERGPQRSGHQPGVGAVLSSGFSS